MTTDINKLIDAEPFVAFSIHTANGGVLRVPTVGYLAVPPGAKRIFVLSDDDTCKVLSPLLITHLGVERGEITSSPST